MRMKQLLENEVKVMKELYQFFHRKVSNDYVFAVLTVFIALFVLTIFYDGSLTNQALLVLCVGVLTYILVVYFYKMHRIQVVLNEDKELNQGAYRMIDTAVFSETHIYAYDHKQFKQMRYADVIVVAHMDNVFEKARPGYQGNHKVICRSQHDTIALFVRDEVIADQVMNFLATQNSHIRLENAPTKRQNITLQELQNWQVKGRF